MFHDAIVRKPGENFADGLTTSNYGIPNYALVLEQHEAYYKTLKDCGLRLTVLDVDLDHPDSTFVEDTCVLVKDHAIFTHPGAESRKGEVDSIRDTVLSFFDYADEILAPGTLDGGDICEAEDTFFIGISKRTNKLGAERFGQIVHRLGFNPIIVDIREIPEILHLKSGLAYLDRGNLVIIEALAANPAFIKYNRIQVDPEEMYAANCILVNDDLLIPKGYPRLADKLSSSGYHLKFLEMSEFMKMDGGLSCLSLRF